MFRGVFGKREGCSMYYPWLLILTGIFSFGFNNPSIVLSFGSLLPQDKAQRDYFAKTGVPLLVEYVKLEMEQKVRIQFID